MSTPAVPLACTAERLGLQQGEVGVEYTNANVIICAKVHSIKTAELIRTGRTRRPVDAIDKHTLFVYGDGGEPTLYTEWTAKFLKYSPVDWRKRTRWFTDSLEKRSLERDSELEAFVSACPTTDTIVTAKATVRAKSKRPPSGPSTSPNSHQEDDASMDDDEDYRL